MTNDNPIEPLNLFVTSAPNRTRSVEEMSMDSTSTTTVNFTSNSAEATRPRTIIETLDYSNLYTRKVTRSQQLTSIDLAVDSAVVSGKKDEKSHAPGRALSTNEMLYHLLKYPEITTDFEISSKV